MTRSDNSALIALTELQTMEKERSERETQERLAEQQRRRQQQQQQRQLALEAQRREAAEQQARRLESEQRRAQEAAERRHRIEQAEARARAEQDAHLAGVQRELSAELDRRQMRRTMRLAATGMGAALLASAAAVVVWMGMSQPTEAPQLAAETVDVDALLHGLDKLHEDNAALRDDLEQMRARAREVVQTAKDDPSPAAEAAAPEPSAARPPRPRPRPRPVGQRPRPKPHSGQDEPTTKRPNPLVFDDKDPLGDLKKKKPKQNK